jgi:hypothetical protein
MVLLLAATLVGSGITLAVMWPLGLQIAIASAPLGGSLLTAVAAISLVIRNSRLMQAEGPTSVAHGRPPARLCQPLRHYPPDRCWIAACRTAPTCPGLSVRLFGR